VREGYFALLILSKWEFSKEYVQTIKRLLQQPDVICRFDLVVLAYAVVDCCCYVVMSCLVQASCYLGARTHYVDYCLILLFAHPAFWIICHVEYFRFVALGVQCL